MSVLLLDASVWLAARDRSDRFHTSASALVRHAPVRPVAALDLTLYEVANVAAARWGSQDEADRLVDLVLAATGERLVRVDQERVRAAIALAAEGDLTVYDASYVACSRQSGWPLVSADLRDLVRPGYACTPDDVPAGAV